LSLISFNPFSHADDVGKEAARLILEGLEQKPSSTIVFPTGKTPIPMYAALRQSEPSRWTHARLFHLDEYYPAPKPGAPIPYETFETYLRRELWDHVPANQYWMEPYFNHPAKYDELVCAESGPDWVILGIGGNGHIAFNEPGSPPDSDTRIIPLSPQTQQDNFGGVHLPGYPTHAMTLGLASILKAKRILLMATGDKKRSIVERALLSSEPPHIDLPASWLKTHPHVTILTDFPL